MISILVALQLAGASGTVSGTVRVADGRNNAYNLAGCSDPSPTGARQSIGGTQPVEEILVRLEVRSGTSIVVSAYGRTNSSGTFSLPWNSGSVSVNNFAVRVISERPDIGATTVTSGKPSFQFRIGDATTYLLNAFPAFATGTVSTGTLTVASGNHIHAYLTARETYAMFTSMDSGGPPTTGGLIRDAMDGLSIVPSTSVSGGFAPFPDVVYISTTVGTSSPGVVAHEIGHALMWRSLGVPQAVLTPTEFLLPAGCDGGGSGWTGFSCEVEKVAFHEGFGELIEALWMWNRDADPPASDCPGGHPRLPDGGSSYDIEASNSCDNGVGNEGNKPGCNARALWDVVDDQPNDGDGATGHDLTSVVSALRVYPWDCFVPCFGDDGCVGEGWPWPPTVNGAPPGSCPTDVNGNNFRDFRFHYVDEFPDQLTPLATIQSANGMFTQDPD